MRLLRIARADSAEGELGSMLRALSSSILLKMTSSEACVDYNSSHLWQADTQNKAIWAIIAQQFHHYSKCLTWPQYVHTTLSEYLSTIFFVLRYALCQNVIPIAYKRGSNNSSGNRTAQQNQFQSYNNKKSIETYTGCAPPAAHIGMLSIWKKSICI